jgi:hypothetical protein
MATPAELTGVVAEHIAAVNAYFSVRDGKIVSLIVINNQPGY